jgi:hypothetical protein
MHFLMGTLLAYVLGMGSVVVGMVMGLPNVVLAGTMLWLGSLVTILGKAIQRNIILSSKLVGVNGTVGQKDYDQPEGSFWIREKDARGMLSQQGSAWVFSDVDGFPARKIDWTIDEVF